MGVTETVDVTECSARRWTGIVSAVHAGVKEKEMVILFAPEYGGTVEGGDSDYGIVAERRKMEKNLLDKAARENGVDEGAWVSVLPTSLLLR